MGLLDRLEYRAGGGLHPGDPALAEWFGAGQMTAAGVRVTPESAMRASAVFSCVRVLAETLASTPLILYRRKGDGGRERATDHRLYRRLAKQPNMVQTRFEWIEMEMAHLLLRGVGYSRIITDRRGGITLVPMHPLRTQATLLDSGRLAYTYMNRNGRQETLLQEEVLRVPFMTLDDGMTPLSVVGAQREAIGASLAVQEYGARFFSNDARPTTWIKFPGKFKNEDDRKDFRKSWQEAQSGVNRFKTAVLEQGMELHEIGMSNEDAQFLETRKAHRAEIAGMFRVPPHLIGDLDRSTNNNIEQQSLEFVKFTMTPHFVRFEQALGRDLLRDGENDEFFFEFLADGLLRGDAKSRAEYYKAALSWGWHSRNEIRLKENENRVDGLDEYMVPTNMTSAKNLGRAGKGKTPPKDQTEGTANEQ